MTDENARDAIARAVEAERKRITDIAGLARTAARFGIAIDVVAAVRARLPVETVRNSALVQMADGADETYISCVAAPKAGLSEGSATSLWRKALRARQFSQC